ncbi:MAG: prolyl oligopeptidase family serine peptidase, partial [Sciscionella sp.]
MNIHSLLGLTTWRAFDVDAHGRVLAGSDSSGSMQLVELEPDGTPTALTALPGACSGRYLPEQRAVLVSHDEGGNERWQISLLRLDSPLEEPASLQDLQPVVADPRYVHTLSEVRGGRIVYHTNRRNGVDFDVIIHNLATGEELTGYDGGGMVTESALSQDSRYLAVSRPAGAANSSQLLLVDMMPETPEQALRELSGFTEAAKHVSPCWSAGDGDLLVTCNSARDFTSIARYSITTAELSWLVTAEGHDLTGAPSPDGSALLVASAVDGHSELAIHRLEDGAKITDIALGESNWLGYPFPAPVFSPDSRYVAVTLSAPDRPGDVALIDVAAAELRWLTDSTAPLRGTALSTPAVHRIDGRIPCFVYPPSTAVEALAGASVMLIHGGPEGQSVLAFHPVLQGLAAAGFAVLVPNVRGSEGYGKAWYSAD